MDLDFSYIVEVKDFLGNLIEHFETTDSNTAYHEYRVLVDIYCDDPDVTVTLFEPEF